MSSNESLQKVTKYSDKVSEVLSLTTITYEDTKNLSQPEKDELMIALTEMSKGTGVDHDRYLAKIDGLLDDQDRYATWENNHANIAVVISNLIHEYGRMPTKYEIAQKTGLSRQTVHKHLREFASDQRYLEHKEQFRFMTDKLLAKVFQYAMNGDMKAAKLYLSAMGALNSTGTVNTQNNYIQINNTILSQDTVHRLSPAQVASIEAIVLERNRAS